jgi:hypothetical protein
MAVITFDKRPITRQYLHSVGTGATAIPEANLIDRWGNKAVKATGVVLGGSVRMGIHDVLTPSASSGLPLAVADVIVLEGWDQIRQATFIQNSGGATIDWAIQTDKV